MTEIVYRIEGADKNGIYGKWRKGGNRRLVIHIHGMTHHAGGLLEVTSSSFFGAHGFDHYRMSLYDRMKDSRKGTASTLTTHQRDIQTVIDHFRPLYDELFITAHSLGGLVTLIMHPTGIKAISLWDPSFDVTHFWSIAQCLTPMPERKQYLLDYGNIFVISEEWVEEIKRYPDDVCLNLAKNITTPVQMIIPQESIFLASPHTSPENYRSAFAGPFDLQRIEGANHTFSNDGDYPRLFDAVLPWLEKHTTISSCP